MNTKINSRLGYSGLMAKAVNGIVYMSSDTDEILRLWQNENGFTLVSRELGSLSDSQIRKVQVMFNIQTLCIDIMEGLAFSRLWCDKIVNFEVVMTFAESIRAYKKVKILP